MIGNTTLKVAEMIRNYVLGIAKVRVYSINPQGKRPWGFI